MSSQGPAVTGSVNYNGFVANPSAGAPVSIGYPFDTDSIRDSSDWIAYKKQTLILNESKTKLADALPEVRYGNDYRIQFLLGRFKNAFNTACGNCSSNTRISGGTVS